jgi:hypothetical protein
MPQTGGSPMTYDFSEATFKDWLKRNRDVLADRSPDEIARTAHFCGFDWEIIFSVLSHFNDAMRGSSFENRAKMQVDCEAYTIEMLAGKVDFHKHWQEVIRYQTRGLDYDE